LHAAGIYEGPNQDNIGNYAISSYTPTLSALRRAFTQDSTPSPISETKVLLIAQSDHESLAPLPNATLEVEQVRDIVPPSSLVHIGTDEGSRVDAVLQTLPDVAVLHLACHGHQDQSDPLNSGFDLLDGRLKLGQLMQVSTKNAQLAYLSACESAAVDETRPDEAVNLAATMLFVGFKSVIATMW
jgi:CHAT domain-containing protein